MHKLKLFLFSLLPLLLLGAETESRILWSLLSFISLPIVIAAIVAFFIIANRRKQKKLRESLSAKTDQAVYEAASADLLQLIHDLSDIGIQTKADKRDEDFEKILRRGWWTFLLRRLHGMLTIPEGLVNTVTIHHRPRGKDSPPRWWYLFCIPDVRISSKNNMKLKTKRLKSTPLIGKVIDTTWQGNDYGSGLAKTLSDDKEVDDFTARVGNVQIYAHSKAFRGWVLEIDRQFHPTIDDWKTIQKIADYLVRSPVGL